jgi:hypothetical protein
MIACDNEGGCPFEWVRCCSLHVCYITLTIFKVPPVMCGLETTNARKVVLLCVQSKEERWFNRWKERKEEITLYKYHFNSHNTTDLRG